MAEPEWLHSKDECGDCGGTRAGAQQLADIDTLDAWADRLGRRWFTRLCALGDGTYDGQLVDDCQRAAVLNVNAATRAAARHALAEWVKGRPEHTPADSSSETPKNA
jgi:hypothetical protein